MEKIEAILGTGFDSSSNISVWHTNTSAFTMFTLLIQVTPNMSQLFLLLSP
jgi:hypothetical protein